MSAILEIRDLVKDYPGPFGAVRALNGVSLQVAAGEFVAIQGPSGCGKSTLLLAAGGLLRPDSGQVRIAGQDPYALSPEERSKFRAGHLGFVFQQFHLIPYLSVLDNVLAPTLALPQRGARARAAELIERFGLQDRRDHVPEKLSIGERQRTALADEPTGNLDRDNANGVLNALAEFAREGGAVLLVTHDTNAAGCAGRTVCMKSPAHERNDPA